MAEPEARRDGDRRNQMRRIEEPDVELVPHIRPRHFTYEFDIKPFRGCEALVDSNQQRGSVGERDISDPQLGLGTHFNNSAAVITDWATSAIFLFWLIAVLRRSA